MFRAPKDYVYLDAVASAGSIRKAAARLHVASTSLNRKILEIEEELGMPLFERLPRGVRLTSAGEVILTAIRRNISDVETANAQIRQLRGLVRGNVSIAVAHSVANDFIQDAITSFQEHHPGVHFKLLVGATSDLVRALMSDETDLLLAHDPAPGKELDEIAVVPQPLFAMMRPDHPLANRSKLRLSDCQPYPLAMGPRSFGGRALLEAVIARHRLALNVVLEANTMRALKAYAQRTDAICFQFEVGTREEAVTGALKAIPLVDPELRGGRLVFAARKDRNLPLPTMSFIETVKQSMSQI
ncbi:DNA-binding transcriptional regulator, LysR family [Pseudooceanicola antarcticus]|uniref:DNA-binding transcriptional regulator, LysR family n=1 Tax=Pseudooceanicola antarcticus TaxID=1247613 RepID=A0A285HWZ9_9RHOB|nr:LysR family transcriptional regulator [Pseudooceanicola antarcticus]PJE27511.1 LysR family transcriptional regulator [Pseudooceanicola antarcticus]SNY39231.1 DNA-binding transcriptional regulator, LysR family [Pseudooceanicola antarcticus]